MNAEAEAEVQAWPSAGVMRAAGARSQPGSATAAAASSSATPRRAEAAHAGEGGGDCATCADQGEMPGTAVTRSLLSGGGRGRGSQQACKAVAERQLGRSCVADAQAARWEPKGMNKG